MTVTKENLKERLELYKGALLDTKKRPVVSNEQIKEFANYLDDIIVDKIKAKDYRMPPGSICGFEIRSNGINLSVSVPIEKTKTIIPDIVDFGTIDDEIEDALNALYKYRIEFDVAASMHENSVEFDIDITLGDDDD
jgi:hypothetical protein